MRKAAINLLRPRAPYGTDFYPKQVSNYFVKLVHCGPPQLFPPNDNYNQGVVGDKIKLN